MTARVYEPDTANITVLGLPGIGVPQRALPHVATWFAAHGARVITLDYRGLSRLGHIGLLRPGAPERIWQEMPRFYQRSVRG